MIDRISLHDLLINNNSEVEKAIVKKISTFSYPQNKDLENYLKYSAITFERAEFSRTTIFVRNGEILGYYSLANQHFIIDENISKTKKANLTTTLGMFKDKKTIPAILIGQVGKNANCIQENCLEKGYLLNDALNHIVEINKVMPYIILRASKEETVRRAINRLKLDRETNIELVDVMWEQFNNLGLYERNVIDTTNYSINNTIAEIKNKISEKTAMLCL